MNAFIRKHAVIGLFVLLCGMGTLISAWGVIGMGNELSIVDGFSEANALREVRNFQEQGLSFRYGLGNVYYPGVYPRDGFQRGSEDATASVTPEGIYTHYPPGPEYLLYAATKILGDEPVSRLRLVPLLIGFGATLFFGLAIRRRFGAMVAWLMLGAFLLAPTTRDGFMGLHYQGYALALLMIEIGCALSARASMAPFVVLGFLQGWLSFDYVFLVTFTPLALELVLPTIDAGYRPRWRLACTRSVLAGASFAAALGLHFLQVWAYWGSLENALRDFAGAAARRSGADATGDPHGFLRQAAANCTSYLCNPHPFHLGFDLPEDADLQDWAGFRFMGLTLGPWWLLVTAMTIAWEYLNPRSGARAIRMDWHLVCLIGAVTSSLWFVIMVNHGGLHRHFLYRHLFFAFFVMALFGAVRLSAALSRVRSIAAPVSGSLLTPHRS